MDKYTIIDKLEKRYAPNLRGEYFPVVGRQWVLPDGNYALTLYETGQLEIMLEKSISVAEYDAMRCMLLQEEQLMSKEQREAMDWFNELSPKAKVAQITLRYQNYMEDQQRELARVGGW